MMSLIKHTECILAQILHILAENGRRNWCSRLKSADFEAAFLQPQIGIRGLEVAEALDHLSMSIPQTKSDPLIFTVFTGCHDPLSSSYCTCCLEITLIVERFHR